MSILLIIQKFDVHPSKHLQYIRQNHRTVTFTHHDILVNVITDQLYPLTECITEKQSLLKGVLDFDL